MNCSKSDILKCTIDVDVRRKYDVFEKKMYYN